MKTQKTTLGALFRLAMGGGIASPTHYVRPDMVDMVFTEREFRGHDARGENLPAFVPALRITRRLFITENCLYWR